jgi:hypothetical protein
VGSLLDINTRVVRAAEREREKDERKPVSDHCRRLVGKGVNLLDGLQNDEARAVRAGLSESVVGYQR